MTVREHLRQVVQGIPRGGSVTLPVEAIRQWLQEDVEDRGDLSSTQRISSTAEAAEFLGVQPATVAEWAKEGRFPNAWKTGSDGGGEWRIPEGDLFALTQGANDRRGGDRVRFDLD